MTAPERTAASLRARMGQWLRPLQEGRGLPPGFRLLDWETDQGITLLIAGAARGRRLRVELEHADPSRPCFARTARFNVYYQAAGSPGVGLPLSPAERAALEAVVEILRAREGELAMNELAETSPRVRVREVEVDRGLCVDGPGAYYLNPYVGCMLACSFCYAAHRADLSRSLEGLPRADWGKWVDVKVNLPEVVAREVRRLPPGTVRMSPIITDPYQPVERKYEITRGCIEAMAGTAFVPLLLTRSRLILRDLDVLARCPGASVGMSVPTDDGAALEAFEPGTEPLEGRLEALRALSAAGLRTFAIVQPMLPLDPARLVDLVAPHARAVRIGPMFEKQRTREIYARLGREDALDEAWERATFEELRARFEARGVAVNPEGRGWEFLR